MTVPNAARTWAGAALSAGQLGTRVSVSGEPRGPLCGMGTCFECRVVDSHGRYVRSCREPEPGRSNGVSQANTPRPSDEARAACRELTAQVLVVGGGPAGLAAAASAAEGGCSVVLLDDNDDLGGQIWRATGAAPAAVPSVRGAARASRSSVYHHWLAACERWRVQIERAAVVIDAPTPREVLVATRGGALRVRAEQMIICTGARELFLPFPGWTLPGVMGAGGLQALAKGGFDVRGLRVVIAGSGPLLLAVAAQLRKRGARVVAFLEQADFQRAFEFGRRLWRYPGKLGQLAALEWQLRGVPRHYASWVVRAEGQERLNAVVIENAGKRAQLACDLLACGFGLVPEVALAGRLGCRCEGGAIVVDDAQLSSVPGVFAAGECTGVGGAELAILEGRIAGLGAASKATEARALRAANARHWDFARGLKGAFSLRPELRNLAQDDTIVCRCEDVPLGALRHYSTPRHAKLQTRAGMGPCQGRVCGPALEFLLGWPGLNASPPFFPTDLRILASFGAAPTPPTTAASPPQQP